MATNLIAHNQLREGETMAEDDALFQKGMPIRREVLGAEYVDASMARADEFMMSFQRATTAWAWGWAWGDGTLDRKTRSLMNLAMPPALNRAHEIKLHVKGALNNGVTVGNALRSQRAGTSLRRLQLSNIRAAPAAHDPP
jgi:4-carboxymuconolactone decarboxylase